MKQIVWHPKVDGGNAQHDQNCGPFGIRILSDGDIHISINIISIYIICEFTYSICIVCTVQMFQSISLVERLRELKNLFF